MIQRPVRPLSLIALAASLCVVPFVVSQDTPAKEAPAKEAPAKDPKAPASPNTTDYRPFTTKAGKKFFAMVQNRTDVAVTFKLQSGKTENMMITALSEVDQNFVRKWSKFRDELLRNREFSDITIKDLMVSKGYQSFEFEIEGNHIFVEGETNGHPTKFLIDTGAGSTIYHVDHAKDIEIVMGEMDQEIHGVAGKQPAAVATVKSIKLGDSVIENRKYLATDLAFGRKGVKPDQDAILGADIMRELDAVISYKESRIFIRPDNVAKANAPKPGEKAKPRYEYRKWSDKNGKTMMAALTDKNETEAIFLLQSGSSAKVALDNLSDADADIVSKWSKFKDDLARQDEFRTMTAKELLELRSYQSTVYRLAGNHVIIDGKVGDVKANILVDTGAYGGVVDLKWAKGAGKLTPGPLNRKIYGIGGEQPAADCPVPSIVVGDCKFNARVLLACDLYKDNGALTDRNHDMIFGANFLREVDAVLSYKEGRLFMRPDQSDSPTASSGGGEKKDE